MSQHAEQFKPFDVDLWFVERLKVHGVNVFDGVTTFELRRQRIREAILQAGFGDVICAKLNRKPVTYAQAFERAYGTPLFT